jgi:hypothetical protein
MAKRVDLPASGQLTELDLVSYGRRGRHAPLEFSRAHLDQIGRTVSGAPEVMVKVSGGGKSAAAVKAHLSYIDRHGKLEVHTDRGEILQSKAVAQHLTDVWNPPSYVADRRSNSEMAFTGHSSAESPPSCAARRNRWQGSFCMADSEPSWARPSFWPRASV